MPHRDTQICCIMSHTCHAMSHTNVLHHITHYVPSCHTHTHMPAKNMLVAAVSRANFTNVSILPSYLFTGILELGLHRQGCLKMPAIYLHAWRMQQGHTWMRALVQSIVLSLIPIVTWAFFSKHRVVIDSHCNMDLSQSILLQLIFTVPRCFE